MRKKKYYAVARGRNPGIYETWFGPEGADAQVNGFPGAVYKSFSTLKEAEEWLSSVSGKKFSTDLKPSSIGTKESVENLPSQPSYEGKVVIYTDGGCIGNPGPGGYGVVLKYRGARKEISGGYRLTTNNRMELMACIVGLQALRVRSAVVLHSDSRYVVDGISLGWAKKWRSKGWMRTKVAKAENYDLWEQLLNLCESHDVEFEWVKGHAGNPENERCDQLSMAAAQQKNLPPDNFYEDHKANRRSPASQQMRF